MGLKRLHRSPLMRNKEYHKSMPGKIPEGTFHISLKLITRYKHAEPILIAKYKYGEYHKGSVCWGSNIDLNVIPWEDNIFIPSIIQSYVLYWYHTYLLHTWIDRTESAIQKHLYWHDIRKAFQKEITSCDTCQRTKLSNIKMVNDQLSNMEKYHGTNSVWI